MSKNNGTMLLGQVATLYDSLHKTPSYTDDGISMVRATDIRRGFIDLTDTEKVDFATFQEYTKKYAPRTGDILFTRVGASYGESGFVNKRLQFCLGQNTVCITPKTDSVSPFYLYCCFNSPQIRWQIDSFVGGGAQPTISLKNIRLIEIPCPPLPTQRKIASILSAYDDLIENNTRRIAILEEMAQAIYREWFVNFRFPGHENVKLVDSPLGMIPEGWVKQLGDVVTLKRGYDLPKKDRRPGTIPLVSSSGVTDHHESAKVKGPGVVTGRYGTLGKVFFIERDFWPLNTTLYVKDFKGSEPLLVVHLLCSLNLASQNAAGAVPGVNRNALHMLDIVFPPSELQRKIAEVFESIETSRRNLLKKNANLRTTRDLLLPKLISGKLDVEDLDIDVGEPLEELTEAVA